MIKTWTSMELLKPYNYKCDTCGPDAIATHCCKTCQKDTCASCISEHHTGHTVDPITKLTSDVNIEDTISTYRSIDQILSNSNDPALCSSFQTDTDHKMENVNTDLTNMDKKYEAKLKELLELESKVKSEAVKKIGEACESKKTEINTKASNISQGLQAYFNELQKFIADRQKGQECKVETIRSEILERVDKKKKDDVDKVSRVLEKVDSFTGQSNSQEKDSKLLNQCIDLIRELNEIQEMANGELPDWSIHVSQACTADDVKGLISVLGTVSEKNTNNDSQSPKLQKELKSLVEVCRSMGDGKNSKLDDMATAVELHGELHTAPSIRPTGPDIKPCLNPMGVHVSVSRRDVPTVKLIALGTADIKGLLQTRLRAWNLDGDWRVNGSLLEVYSDSKLNAKRCERVLLDAMQCKTVKLREEYDMVVDTDKWAEFKARIQSENLNKVWIYCNRQRMSINICSICSLILDNVANSVKRFLRDNQVLKINLKYTTDAVKRLKKRKKWIDSVQSRYSEFGVYVTFNTGTEDEVRVQGTGFGVANAVIEVNNMVNGSELTKDDDEDRFSTDDEEERFTDEDGVEKTSPPTKLGAICPSIRLSAGQSDTHISAVCFPGNDTIIYVVTGDIMSLPVEAIVNPANSLLKHDGGLAKALCEKGGRIIQEECFTYAHGFDNRRVPEGDVYCSSAGNLPLRAILHTVGKKWEGDGLSTMATLKTAVHNTLQIASLNMIEIIAVPAIGTGAYKVPIEMSTDAIVETIRLWCDNPESRGVREVYLCDRGVEATQSFVTAMKKHFNDAPILTGDFPSPTTAAMEPSKPAKTQPVLFM